MARFWLQHFSAFSSNSQNHSHKGRLSQLVGQAILAALSSTADQTVNSLYSLEQTRESLFTDYACVLQTPPSTTKQLCNLLNVVSFSGTNKTHLHTHLHINTQERNLRKCTYTDTTTPVRAGAT
jgi:hypothetical protein